MRLVLALPFALVACGSPGESGSLIDPPDPPAPCPPGERAVGEVCIAAGWQDNGCPAGEMAVDGACVPAGVPPELCASGFSSDGLGGCTPILPAEPCAPGLFALPGDRMCHEIASCGTGTWGDIPVEGDTQFVDISYAGAEPSDGSATRPWTRIADGIGAAAPGAIVAIAEGTYDEDLRVEGKPVRLLGRCPTRVSVVGSATRLGAVMVLSGADGSVVRGFRITGAASGVMVSGSLDVVLEELWLHELSRRGVAVETGLGPTRVTVRSSLVERATEFGVFSAGTELTIEGSVVRETRQQAGSYGRGISARNQAMTGDRGTLRVHGSVVEANHRAAIFTFATDATVEATVMRDTLAGETGSGSPGLWATMDENGVPSSVELFASFVARNTEVGILVNGSDVMLAATTVRDNLPSAANPEYGRGIEAQIDPNTGQGSLLHVVQSTIADNQNAGVTLWGADATFEGTLVRGTSGLADYTVAGIGADVETITQAPARLTMRGSRIEGNRDVGILMRSSEAHIEGTAIVDTLTGPGGLGRAIHVNGTDPEGTRASLELSASRIAGSPEFGLFALDSDVSVSGTAIGPSAALPLHIGVLIGWDADRSVRGSAEVRSSSVEQAHMCGIYAIDADVHIEDTVIRGTLPEGTRLGDALLVDWHPGGTTAVSVARSLIDSSARAAMTTFASIVPISATRFECNAIDLDVEAASFAPSAFDDRGGNSCGCGADVWPCKATSTNVAPPDPLPPPLP